MEVLSEIEKVDPSNPELITLQNAAKQGREQEQRRRILEQLQNEVSVASTAEELTRAAQLVEQALQRLPGEPSLMKLQGNLARKLRDEEIRRRVDEVALRCRSLIDTSPEEALKLVHQLLHEAPGNERLLALQSTIVGHISDRTQEQTRSQYLQRAHEALSKGNYIDALRLLESCQREGIASPEITELIDFARQEAASGQKNTQIQGLMRQAEDLMARGAYAEVVDLLGGLQQEPETASLIFVLEDARSRLQSFQRNIDSTLQAVETLRHHEQYTEAVRLLGDFATSRSADSVPSRKRSLPHCARPTRMNWLRFEESVEALREPRRFADRPPVLPENPTLRCWAVSFLSSIPAGNQWPIVRRRRQSIGRAPRSTPETRNKQARFSIEASTSPSTPAATCKRNGKLSTRKREGEKWLETGIQDTIASPEFQTILDPRNGTLAVFTG